MHVLGWYRVRPGKQRRDAERWSVSGGWSEKEGCTIAVALKSCNEQLCLKMSLDEAKKLSESLANMITCTREHEPG